MCLCKILYGIRCQCSNQQAMAKKELTEYWIWTWILMVRTPTPDDIMKIEKVFTTFSKVQKVEENEGNPDSHHVWN